MDKDNLYKSAWNCTVSSFAPTDVAESSGNRMSHQSPIFWQQTTLPSVVNHHHHLNAPTYLPSYPTPGLADNHNYQDRYSASTELSPFVSTADTMILNSTVSAAHSAVDDKMTQLRQLPINNNLVSQATTGAHSSNLSGLLESSRKICSDFMAQNQQQHHHLTCYDYGAISTRFAQLLESLKSSLGKNAPTSNSKSLADS